MSKVADMSAEELKALIRGAIKEEIEELLEMKSKLFELETLQALTEVKEGKVKVYDTVEEMLKDVER